MERQNILRSLEKQRDELFAAVTEKPLSQQFGEFFDSMSTALGVRTDGIDEDMLREILAYSKDKSHDTAFRKKAESVYSPDNASAISELARQAESLFTFIAKNRFETTTQALFIEYDDYESRASVVQGLGKQNYPLPETPRYISDEIDPSKIVFDFIEGIDFGSAWPDLEEFEWTTICLDSYYYLQKLFQLNSSILLHKALASLEDSGKMSFFSLRPLTFYINEHDCEVTTLYRLN